jgi:hypothetical protein
MPTYEDSNLIRHKGGGEPMKTFEVEIINTYSFKRDIKAKDQDEAVQKAYEMCEGVDECDWDFSNDYAVYGGDDED